jgi:predicted nucleic acid-binding protein
MIKIFADTGAWIALADKDDQYHHIAKEVYASIQRKKIPIVITDYIFDETVTWLHYKIGHSVACDWGTNPGC